MTVLVGVLCKDGIVIGADSSATSTYGTRGLIEQPTKKIDIIDNKIIVAGTGAVGLGQRFKHIVEQAWEEKRFKEHIQIGKLLSKNTLEDFRETYLNQLGFGALVAFPCQKKPYLCEFASHDFQPEFKEENRIWYVAMGSGQALAEPFLAFIKDIFWSSEVPTCQEGILAATWALTHTIQLNPGGIKDPINIALLHRSNGGELEAKMLEEEELNEHLQYIDEIKEKLRSYRFDLSQEKNSPDLPV